MLIIFFRCMAPTPAHGFVFFLESTPLVSLLSMFVEDGSGHIQTLLVASSLCGILAIPPLDMPAWIKNLPIDDEMKAIFVKERIDEKVCWCTWIRWPIGNAVQLPEPWSCGFLNSTFPCSFSCVFFFPVSRFELSR